MNGKIILSFRDKSAYIGNPYHVPIPMPTNTMIPSNSSDAALYDDSDTSKMCPTCITIKLIKDDNSKDEMVCENCGGRFSHQTRDKSYSHYGTTPGTLDYGGGSNVNNEQGGEVFHPGQFSNQNTFSGNLGK